MRNITKEAVYYFLYDNKPKALSLVKDFRIGLTKEERSILQRGHQASTHPSFFTQIGKDPQQLIQEAYVVFERKFILQRTKRC